MKLKKRKFILSKRNKKKKILNQLSLERNGSLKKLLKKLKKSL